MSLSSKLGLRTIAMAAMTLGLLAGTATVTSAAGEISGDDRATAYPKNAKTCDARGVGGGEKLTKGEDFTFVVRKDDEGERTYVDIVTVQPDVTVTAIVIKGGNVGYNVYVPREQGMSDMPPWLDMHAPINPSDKPAEISHWFVCGERDDETTTTTTETTETTTSETSETSTTTSESTTTEESTTTSDSAPVTTTTSGAGGVVTTTTEAPVAPAGQNDDLASTGFSGGWLVGLGALLLAGGGALLFLSRMRRGKA